jgi:GntR family transcriptional regulator
MSISERPVYLRLRDEIVAMILDGLIAEGDALPSVRAFAADQGANPLTVAKAYQSFQEDGLVTVRRGVGMFVVPGAAARLRESARSRFLNEEWPAIAGRVRRLGITPAELFERA